ncbi:MAG: hypothetical protein WC852_06700 [Candidatus Nanoarchaeia archaeon]
MGLKDKTRKLRKQVIKNANGYFNENWHLFGVIYLPFLLAFIVGLKSKDWSFTDKLIDISFIMFGVFIVAITLSGKKFPKKKMLSISYFFFLSGVLLLINSHILKLSGSINQTNWLYLCLLLAGSILFIGGIHKTFKLLGESINTK